MSRDVSVRPAHLIDDDENKTMPSALIPFCAFQDKPIQETSRHMGFSKEWHLCNHFRPAILHGQLCYSLDMASLEKNLSKSGIDNGLILVLDTQKSVNDDRVSERKTRKQQGLMNFADIDDKHDTGMTKVFLHTLSPFTGYQAGSYALSSLKRMIGTENFKSMPDEKKKCQNEVFEDCQARMFCNAVKTSCKCVPWALTGNCPSETELVSRVQKQSQGAGIDDSC